MNEDHIMLTPHELPVDEHTQPLAEFEGYECTPTARGFFTAHELTTDVDGEPLGVESVELGMWEVGSVEPTR